MAEPETKINGKGSSRKKEDRMLKYSSMYALQ